MLLKHHQLIVTYSVAKPAIDAWQDYVPCIWASTCLLHVARQEEVLHRLQNKQTHTLHSLSEPTGLPGSF
jgi:hypothetical protein